MPCAGVLRENFEIQQVDRQEVVRKFTQTLAGGAHQSLACGLGRHEKTSDFSYSSRVIDIVDRGLSAIGVTVPTLHDEHDLIVALEVATEPLQVLIPLKPPRILEPPAMGVMVPPGEGPGQVVLHQGDQADGVVLPGLGAESRMCETVGILFQNHDT